MKIFFTLKIPAGQAGRSYTGKEVLNGKPPPTWPLRVFRVRVVVPTVITSWRVDFAPAGLSLTDTNKPIIAIAWSPVTAADADASRALPAVNPVGGATEWRQDRRMPVTLGDCLKAWEGGLVRFWWDPVQAGDESFVLDIDLD